MTTTMTMKKSNLIRAEVTRDIVNLFIDHATVDEVAGAQFRIRNTLACCAADPATYSSSQAIQISQYCRKIQATWHLNVA